MPLREGVGKVFRDRLPGMPRFLILFVSIALLGAPSARASDDLSSHRAEVRRALESAARGPLHADAAMRRLLDHPLAPWLEYARLRRGLGSLTPAQAEAFLRAPGSPAAGELFREAWLNETLRRQDWAAFLRSWNDSQRLELRCGWLQARLASAPVDEALLADIEATWRFGRSLPDRCDPAIAALQAAGRLTPALRWERILLAAEAGEAGLMRFLARGLDEAGANRVRDYAAFLEAAHERALSWPADERSRRIATLGLSRLARTDPDAAETLLARLTPALRLGEAERGAVLYQIALWTAASYGPDSARRLAAVPASVNDERLNEWRVREAMARGHDGDALAAIEAMPEAQRVNPRWRWFEARLRERAGETDLARALYAEAARTATFHGFLAADRLDLPYALCPRNPDTPPAIAAEVARHPGLIRALELYRLDRVGWATAEWRHLMTEFDAVRRIEAVRLAREAFWHDRAVFFLGREDPAELELYRLRFPLSYSRTIREAAELHRLEPAMVAAEIRAESAWMRRARSHADARGLMQVLPATAASVARRHDLPYRNANDLYRASLNIQLGTAYLREMIDRHGGRYYQAIAAYNAGPGPVERWNQQRGQLDPDFWIETIPFHETREYVPRVLAFSIIYDWRLGQAGAPASDRMLGLRVERDRRRDFACPTPTLPAESVAP